MSAWSTLTRIELPLALPVIGSEESVGAMTRSLLVDFHAAHYRPERAVLAVAGTLLTRARM